VSGSPGTLIVRACLGGWGWGGLFGWVGVGWRRSVGFAVNFVARGWGHCAGCQFNFPNKLNQSIIIVLSSGLGLCPSLV
jgi:hypothetical protein